MTTTGFELEVSRGATSVIDGLRTLGLTEHSHLHVYHCSCADCQPRPFFGPQQKWFKTQQDCTANGEFISGIFEYGSDELDQAILGLGHVLLKGVQVETQNNVGNHVHVGRDGLNASGLIRVQRLFARYGPDLAEIAAGPRSDMRQYNGALVQPGPTEPLWTATRPPNMNYPQLLSSHTMSMRRHTVEFRLWNAVRAPWRIRTHVGLSVAFMEAAKAGQDAVYDDPRPMEDVIGDFMDAQTWAGVIRQRYSKGGLSGQEA